MPEIDGNIPKRFDEVRWGIIGCGDVCEIKSGPAFYRTPQSQLSAVMRRDAAKAEDFAQRHGVATWYANADELIADPRVNIVYIATPPGSHAEYALRVAAAGKACYLEKPMARTHGECRQINSAFAARRLPLFVAYYRRGMPRFLKAKALIDSGEIGAISGTTYCLTQPVHRNVSPGWRVHLPESGAGLFLDLGSHTLDILDYLLGPLRDVSGLARNVSGSSPSVEDSVALSFTAAGAPGVASWNFASEVEQDLIQIHGTRGTLSFSTFGDDPIRLTRGTQIEEFPFPRPAHVHSGLVETIVSELTGGGAICPSTGESAARTSKVMDDVLSSFYGPRDLLFPAVTLGG